MSSEPEPLFHIAGELDDEDLAALTAVLLARLSARDPAVAPGGSDGRQAQWRYGYRSPRSWR